VPYDTPIAKIQVLVYRFMIFEVVTDMPEEIVEPEIICSKCGATTESGILGNPTGGFSRWEGPKIGRFRRKKVRVTAFRCTKCGYIEMWAPDPD
jgi:hypothetical protein